MKQNAMTREDKEHRRRVLLDAAHELFHKRGELPPVADIAEAAGLAKGTVYLYFRSKEEIFIALLEDDFVRLFESLSQIIALLPASPHEAAGRFSESYSAVMLNLTNLLPLASRANGILEQNLPLETMRRFKVMLATRLAQGGTQLETKFPNLGLGEGSTLLLQTYALTLGLWQALDYPERLRKLMSEEALRPLDRHFAKELEAAVRIQWLGMLTGH